MSDTDHGPFHSERGYTIYRDAPRTNGAGSNGQGAADGGNTNNRRTDDRERANGGNGQYWKRQSGGHSWDDPDWSILDDRRGELPDFPMDTLSDPCRGWVNRAAHGAGATPAHVAAPLLGTVASLIGTARRVRASRSWTQPMTTWTALVGLSGTSKTPGIDATKRALSQIERERRSEIIELRRAHEGRVKAAKAARASWKKEVESAAEKSGTTE